MVLAYDLCVGLSDNAGVNYKIMLYSLQCVAHRRRIVGVKYLNECVTSQLVIL